MGGRAAFTPGTAHIIARKFTSFMICSRVQGIAYCNQKLWPPLVWSHNAKWARLSGAAVCEGEGTAVSAKRRIFGLLRPPCSYESPHNTFRRTTSAICICIKLDSVVHVLATPFERLSIAILNTRPAAPALTPECSLHAQRAAGHSDLLCCRPLPFVARCMPG